MFPIVFCLLLNPVQKYMFFFRFQRIMHFLLQKTCFFLREVKV